MQVFQLLNQIDLNGNLYLILVCLIRNSSFHFVEAGSIVKKADKLRAKQAPGEEKKEMEIEKTPEELEKTTQVLSQLTVLKFKKGPKEPVPDIEWWDKNFINGNSYELDKIKTDDVTIYVEHPVPIKPPSEKGEPPAMPMFLTKKEQKKLRRRARMEREKEKQEKIMLGILPPPKPKVKISNLMRVLGAEATADPTQIEQEVRKQMAEREANHEARNQARKLSKEQKKEKKKKKLENDQKVGTSVAVFRSVYHHCIVSTLTNNTFLG